MFKWWEYLPILQTQAKQTRKEKLKEIRKKHKGSASMFDA
jgi:hypothetical protein